jgi:hypothetical protein
MQYAQRLLQPKYCLLNVTTSEMFAKQVKKKKKSISLMGHHKCVREGHWPQTKSDVPWVAYQ